MSVAALGAIAAGVVAAGALLAAGAALVSTGHPRTALHVLLDLLLAAGLLRLLGGPDLVSVATAAGLLLVRRLAGSVLLGGGTAHAGGRPREPSASPGTPS